MSQFTFDNLVTELVRLDAPLKSGKPMQWRKKTLSIDQGLSPRKSSSRTPGKTPLLERSNSTCSNKTPSRTKTPGTPGGRLVVPQHKTGQWKTPSKTPNKRMPLGQQDRFIPTRSTTDVDMAHYAMNKMGDENGLSPTKCEYQKQLSEAMGVPTDSKILSFQASKPKPAEAHMNKLKVIYSSKLHKGQDDKIAATRVIPQVPDRILDAPELLDDYYLNLLDWSANNHVAVALGSSVYIWNASSGSIDQLCTLEDPEEYISSVSWIKEGNILAAGTSNGNVELWDVGEQKMVRNMTGHAARVGSLAWNTYICSSGSRSGNIHHHDVRVAEHQVGVLANHTQEVCGLSWSPDGRFLASGGNDNVLNVWNVNLGTDVQPILTFTHHQAAVKALAWCPWQHNILASGGGTADRHIRLWNVNTGSLIAAKDTESQVCSILWNKEYKELISGHGFSQNQLTIWKYPEMAKIADLTGHNARVLCLGISPDGTTVASAAADETIRIWKCFATTKTKKSVSSKPGKESLGLMKATCIR